MASKRKRLDRWDDLRSRIVSNILLIDDSNRLKTLLNRMNTVNRDNRETNNRNGAGLDPHIDKTMADLIKFKNSNKVGS